MHQKLRAVLARVNFTVPICRALVGKDHHYGYRMAVGVMVMLTGVVIAKTAGHHEVFAVHLVGDGIGYAVHALGFTPFLEKLIELFAE